MACATHPDREEVTTCTSCEQALCGECVWYANSDPVCAACAEMLQRTFDERLARRGRNFWIAAAGGGVLAGGAVAGWEWWMHMLKFREALFTPIVMIGVILGMAMVMRRLADAASKGLCIIAWVFACAVLLRGEYILYLYSLFHAAQQGLTAEQLLRYSMKNTYWTHLLTMGPFDYLYMLAAFYITWRRLWPMRPEMLSIVKPAALQP